VAISTTAMTAMNFANRSRGMTFMEICLRESWRPRRSLARIPPFGKGDGSGYYSLARIAKPCGGPTNYCRPRSLRVPSSSMSPTSSYNARGSPTGIWVGCTLPPPPLVASEPV
jgi:hypothetical protein